MSYATYGVCIDVHYSRQHECSFWSETHNQRKRQAIQHQVTIHINGRVKAPEKNLPKTTDERVKCMDNALRSIGGVF